MVLPRQAVFGDYAILFNLKSNIVFRTGEYENSKHLKIDAVDEELCQTSFMCCRREIILDLCELYPKTHEALKKIAVQKRELYLHFLNAARDLNSSRSGVPRGIDSRNLKFR